MYKQDKLRVALVDLGGVQNTKDAGWHA
jgi:hypothetical protein